MTATITDDCRPVESANPADDPRVELASSPGDGASSSLEALRDTDKYQFSDLFHHSGGSEETAGALKRAIDFTPPATSFRLSDVPTTSASKRNQWERIKALHHDTGYDYTGTNRSSRMARFRTDITYCQSIAQALEAPDHVQQYAVTRAMSVNTNRFTKHYGGYIGAVLAFAATQLAGNAEEFIDSHWNERFEEVVDGLGYSFDHKKLVDYAFRNWGGHK